MALSGASRCPSPTSVYRINDGVGIDFIEVCMYQKCLLLRQCRVVNSNDLLRKKWNNSLRTKPLQLSSGGHSNFLDTVTYICDQLLILEYV